MEQHGDVFSLELHFWTIMLARYFDSIQKIQRKFDEWRHQQELLIKPRKHSGSLSRKMWPRYLTEIVMVYNRMVVSADAARTAMPPYLECLSERLSFYQEMSEKYPEDIPIMKRYMVSTGKITSLSPSQIKDIQNHISGAQAIVQRIKGELLRLAQYFAQFEDPEVASHPRRSLQYFLSLSDE